MKYYFILGKNPDLSKAEIEAVLNLWQITFKTVVYFNNVLILDLVKKIDAEKLCDRLGGTIKIGQVLGEIADLNDLGQAFFKLFDFKETKFFFGFSLYALADNLRLIKLVRKINALGLDIKRMLREDNNISSRLVSSRELELSSVIVQKNKLLKNGADICLFFSSDNILIGQTLAVQKFEAYGQRDFGRPNRDDLSGMLPPKLAQIMLNFAQLKDEAVILDPFCGSGTILQEALILGYKNLIGSDISPKAISDTKNNLEWLKSLIPNLQLTTYNLQLFQSDVKLISKQIKPNSINAIITEPFLGQPLRGGESREQLVKAIKELEQLYLSAFTAFANILKKGGNIVMVFPVYIYRNEKIQLNIDADIRKMGFKFIETTTPLYYFREGQKIYRQIRLLTF